MANLFTCRTDGKGLWTRKKKTVPIKQLRVEVQKYDGRCYGELLVYYDTNSWDTYKDGLIYTDPQWLNDLRFALHTAGFSFLAVADIDYSEQGMQGRDYVSLDVEADFIKEIDPLYRFTNNRSIKGSILTIEVEDVTMEEEY